MNESFEALARRKNLTKEEKAMIDECRRRNAKYGFDFQAGWTVDFYKHKCGHKELLQHPKTRTKKAVREDALTHKCTMCTINFAGFRGK